MTRPDRTILTADTGGIAVTSRQSQAWFLIRYLRRQGFVVGVCGEGVSISCWHAAAPRDIDREILESFRCLKSELVQILRLEERVWMARRAGARPRKRRTRWTYQRRSK